MTGKGIGRQECQLSRYENPAFHDIGQGINYIDPAFTVKPVVEQQYAHVMGYWTSYPNSNNSYAEIVKERLALTLETTPQDLMMDIYEPNDRRERQRPLVVMIHGGAFYNGDKADEEYVLWCQEFAKRGYLAVSVNYRLGYKIWPTAVERAAYCALQDVNAALRYLLAHSREYNIDPDRIYLAGCSAGAIAALNVAFMTNADRPESTREQASHTLFGKRVWAKDLGNIDAVEVSPAYHRPIKVRAVCNMWGGVFDLDILRNASTPILSIHGAGDPVVNVGKGAPFAGFFRDMAEATSQANNSKKWSLNNAWDIFMDYSRNVIANALAGTLDSTLPPLYGSRLIDDKARSLGHTSKFKCYDQDKHTLIRDGENRLNRLHADFTAEMLTFFRDEMIRNRVSLKLPKGNSPLCYIANPADVETCSWEVVGGIIVAETENESKVHLLLFGDEAKHTVKVKGLYKTGIPFECSLEL